MPPQSETSARILAFAAICLAVTILYGQTLQTPFYLDDPRILGNPYLLGNLRNTLGQFFAPRGVTYVSFSLNHWVFGNSLAAFHATNIMIHAVSGCLVFLLLKRLLSGYGLPLAGALLFAVHPLQTQAVTYTVQRATSLGTLFVLLAFLCHLRARDVASASAGEMSRTYWLAHSAAIVAALLAMLSKENTVTFPLVILAYDYLFPSSAAHSGWRRYHDKLAFFALPLLLSWYWYAVLPSAADSVPTHAALSSLRGATPLRYLATEFSVVWQYLRLLLLPYGQALEHNYPVAQRLLTAQNGVAGCALIALLAVAWRMRRRLPLVTFGAIWFFLGLAVESSVIPLDPLVEHRLYLPMFGAVLVTTSGLPAILGARRSLILIGLALAIHAPLTWKRNRLWQDPVRFYEDNLEKYPDSERALAGLNHHYRLAGRMAEARRILEDTLLRYPENYVAYRHLAFNWFEEGRQQEALALLDRGLAVLPEHPSLYEAAATLSQERSDIAGAVAYLEHGIARTGRYRPALIGKLGELYLGVGEAVLAEQVVYEGLASHPDNALLQLILGKAFYAQSRWQDALRALQRARQLAPLNPEPIEGIGKSALQMRDLATARWALHELEPFDREGWQRLSSAIRQVELSSPQR